MLSITQVYERLDALGKTAPGSVRELAFFAFGHLTGITLALTHEDEDHAGTETRDPLDKDARLKDFGLHDELIDWCSIRQAFHPLALVKIWGAKRSAKVRAHIKRLLESKTEPKDGLEDAAALSILKESYAQRLANALGLPVCWHARVGLAVAALALLQPFNAWFRPAKSAPERRTWLRVHKYGGFATLTGASSYKVTIELCRV